MKDEVKKKDQLIHELIKMRQRICKLEISEAESKRDVKKFQFIIEKLRKIIRGTIQAVAYTVETRDPYTTGHQQRVSDLARAIATEMGLPKDQIDEIRMAGLIHDIGKVNVPAEILSRPGQLNNFEFDLIKDHPKVGHNIVKQTEFPWSVAQIILQHHERMNGSGYPSGLSGDEMILDARILSVADVVEAMSSPRPYRAALGIDKALEEISNNRGKLYDSNVVGACMNLFLEKEFQFRLKSRHKDITKEKTQSSLFEQSH